MPENRNVKRDRSLLWAWLPAALWSAIIVLQSMNGSASNTGALLDKLAIRLFGEIDPATFEVFHHILRKAGHFLGYGLLGYFCFRALLQTLRNAPRWMNAALAALCASFGAALDEWHQSFLPDRGGQLQDVALDAFGAVAIVSLATIFAMRLPWGRGARDISR
jgi:VanZ family protein